MKFGSLSGSLQRLIDGLEYLTGGIGVDITTNSFQQIVVSLAASAGAPGAPNESIQFNNAGAFDGSANLTYDGAVVRITGSLAAGLESNAAGLYSVAEGFGTLAFGDYSHSEGYLTTASALYSHTEGESTIASTNADGSHVEGLGTIASGAYQHVQGQYNKRDNNYSLMVVGNGTGDDNADRSDILRVEMTSVQVSGSVLQSGSTSVVGFMGGAPGSPTTIGDDVFFFVSGSSGSMGTTDRGVAAFGGDVSISGSLKVGTNSITITTNYIQLGSTAHKVTKAGSDLVFYDDNVPAGATLSSLIGGGGGTPSAPLTSVQYNNAGAFGGSSDFTYDSSNGSLYLTGSFMQGLENFAVGDFSHAEGTGSFALGDYSHAEGSGSVAYGTGSHAEGATVTFEGEGGPETRILTASGSYAHAEGAGTSADGDYSHAEGYITFAKSLASHAEGVATSAWAPYSHAEGASSTTYGTGSHAEGQGTSTVGSYSHAEGSGTTAEGTHSHAEGQQTKTYNAASHAEGRLTFASASWSHAEGYDTDAFELYAHSEGYQTMAEGLASHAEGRSTKAYASYSHSEGRLTVTSGSYSHAEGFQSKTYGGYDHAEGFLCETFSVYSHAEGEFSDAVGQSSHAEGYSTIANGNYSHSEGYDTEAVGIGSHAEGHTTKSDANYSHAEGYQTVASGTYSHAAGEQTVALGLASYAGGFVTIASGSHQHVIGKYNQRDNTHSLFVVGVGTTDANEFRKDVLRAEPGAVEVTGSFWQKNTTTYTSTVGFMGADTIVDPTTKGSDVFFYTSGSIGSAGTATRGASLFGGDVVVSGSLSLGSGSNLPTGIVYLDGGNPGVATVTNSLVTTNSMIFLTKQANNNPSAGPPVVSAKTAGSFTITCNHNGDADPVAYLIINPANS